MAKVRRSIVENQRLQTPGSDRSPPIGSRARPNGIQVVAVDAVLELDLGDRRVAVGRGIDVGEGRRIVAVRNAPRVDRRDPGPRGLDVGDAHRDRCRGERIALVVDHPGAHEVAAFGQTTGVPVDGRRHLLVDRSGRRLPEAEVPPDRRLLARRAGGRLEDDLLDAGVRAACPARAAVRSCAVAQRPTTSPALMSMSIVGK